MQDQRCRLAAILRLELCAAELDIVSDVPFTSASGVFLTGENRTVPAPGTAVLLAVGFVGIGYRHRKRSALPV